MTVPLGHVHVDDFIDDFEEDKYARFVLCLFRLPSALRLAFWPFIQQHPLYCTWCPLGDPRHAGRQRVIGASTMGDIWLTDDLRGDQDGYPLIEQAAPRFEKGYTSRVSISECSEWSDRAQLRSPHSVLPEEP